MGLFNWRRSKPVVTPGAAPAAPKPAGWALDAMVDAIRAMTAKRESKPISLAPYVHPPKVMPEPKLRMAMDSSLAGWAGEALNQAASEGMEFLGYPYLSLLAQRPEYRVISETIATEATREWIEFKSVGTDGDSKSERIKELIDEFDRLNVRDHFATAAIQDGFFGRSHLFLDFGDGDFDDPRAFAELKTDIGDGRDAKSRGKVSKERPLRRLQNVEPVWTYPTTYNATNPLAADWYNPQVWYTMGKEVHRSRLLTFIGHPVPDLLKPAYSFGGLSLSQMAKPYVDIWLDTRQSIGTMIHSFSVMVLMTDLSTILQPGNGAALATRVNLFNELRDNAGAFVVNKATEDFKNVSASLAGLHELQAQSQEHMMSVARIPAVKFTGIQPTGLNASSEGEIKVFYDTIKAYQNFFFRENLTRVMHFVMLSLWGEVDEEIVFDFVALWSLSEKEKAEVRKMDAETGQILVDTGAVSQQEERKRVASDPESGYSDIDVDDLPDLEEEEMEGLEPEGGRPQVVAQEVEERDKDDAAAKQAKPA